MAKKFTLSFLIIIFLLGCSAHNPVLSSLQTERKLAEYRNKLIDSNLPDNIKEHKKIIKEVLKRSRVKASTMKIKAVKTGLVRQVVGIISLDMLLQELNGVGANFDTYEIQLICTHNYGFRSVQEERIGKFFFQQPIPIEPLGLIRLIISTDGWLRKQINDMNRLLSSDRVTVIVSIYGKDDHGYAIEANSKGNLI